MRQNNKAYEQKHWFLTPNTWAIQPSLARSKWNMDEICGLKFQLSYVDMPQDFFWNSSMPTATIDVLWCQPIKLIHVVSTSEFHEYWWNDIDFIFFVPSI